MRFKFISSAYGWKKISADQTLDQSFLEKLASLLDFVLYALNKNFKRSWHEKMQVI